MKNKNNLLIIAIVIFAVLTVIAVVLITGSGGGVGIEADNSSAPNEIVISEPEESVIDLSEPQSVPEESSVSESVSNSYESEPVSSSENTGDNMGEKIASSASALVGSPFSENGESPGGFDNSGFIYYVLRENGYITCPRTTLLQSKMGTHVDRGSLKKGDLVFFGESGDADFGGIYIGDNKMVAALSVGTSVREVDITSDYYVSNFVYGVSIC